MCNNFIWGNCRLEHRPTATTQWSRIQNISIGIIQLKIGTPPPAAVSALCPASTIGIGSLVQLHRDGFQCPHIGARARGVPAAGGHFVNMPCYCLKMIRYSRLQIAKPHFVRNRIPIGNIRQGKGRKMQELISQTLPWKSKENETKTDTQYLFFLWLTVQYIFWRHVSAASEQRRQWVMLRVAEHLSQWVLAGGGWGQAAVIITKLTCYRRLRLTTIMHHYFYWGY